MGEGVRLQTILLFLAALVWQSGCVYIHDAALQKTAEQAQAEFQAVSTNPPYSAFLSKHATQLAITERVFQYLHKGGGQNENGDVFVLLDTLPSLSWSGLMTRRKRRQQLAQIH